MAGPWRMEPSQTRHSGFKALQLPSLHRRSLPTAVCCSALGNVMHALASKNAHVPFRDSKLTQLLQAG